MKNDAFIKLVDEADSAYVGIDNFGIILVRGWSEDLQTLVPIKNYVKHNRQLEHRQSVIATSTYAKKDKREVSISFFLERS